MVSGWQEIIAICTLSQSVGGAGSTDCRERQSAFRFFPGMVYDVNVFYSLP